MRPNIDVQTTGTSSRAARIVRLTATMFLLLGTAANCGGSQLEGAGTGGRGGKGGAHGGSGGAAPGDGGAGGNGSGGDIGSGGGAGATGGGGAAGGGTGGGGLGGSGSGGGSAGGASTGGAGSGGSSGGSSGGDGGGGHAGFGGGAGAGARGGAAGGGGAAGAGGSGGATTSESVHYYGRWNVLSDRAITVNSGSHVGARFSGTAISARFDTSLNQTPNPTLAWKIDNAAWKEGELAAELPLASGLSSGTHEVTLMVRGLNENQRRWSPPLVSSITFLGFKVTGGAVEVSPRPVRPKIEFLGDSITEGVAVWSSRNGQTTPCWRTDGRIAYASQTAQLLNVEWRQVGFGRQGLLIVGNGGVPRANDAFNWIYEGVRRDSWQPDLVIVNQGTNDSSTAASQFRPAYTTFLGTIRAAYPQAKIVAMRPFGGAQAASIKAEVDARRAAGDTRVHYVDTTGWLGSSDFTDGVHPNAQGSTKAAEALAAALRTIGVP